MASGIGDCEEQATISVEDRNVNLTEGSCCFARAANFKVLAKGSYTRCRYNSGLVDALRTLSFVGKGRSARQRG